MKTIAQQLNVTKFPFKIKDENGNLIYYEDSLGFWYKYEYDSDGSLMYYESSEGIIIGNRQKQVELTMDEIADKLGIDVKLLKIKK